MSYKTLWPLTSQQESQTIVHLKKAKCNVRSHNRNEAHMDVYVLITTIIIKKTYVIVSNTLDRFKYTFM